MPELPEVHTIVTDLNKLAPRKKITDVWTDVSSFRPIKNLAVGEKIIKIERRGKNILIRLTGDKTLLIHQKMTGHLMYGKWVRKKNKWESVLPGPMRDDPENRFIHLIISLSNGRQLGLCDMRKFAKAVVLKTEKATEEMSGLGPELFDKSFNFKKFKGALVNRSNKKIKSALMDQTVIAGIGNIYSDEILWAAGTHPIKKVSALKESELKKIFNAIKPVLRRAIKARGSSYIDYRDAQGKKGKYQEMQNAYGLGGKKCKKRDGGIMEKIRVDGRSACFCSVHQAL